MIRDDFAIFILTHGRPNNQLTLNTLLNGGYSGNWYLILDDQDKTVQQYIDNYGADRIIIFNKNHYINTVETVTNSPMDKCILYAKAATEEIAKSLSLKSFILADDDIYGFRFRYPDNDILRSVRITSNMDTIISAVDSYLMSHNIGAVSFSYTSMFMSGVEAFSEHSMQKYRVPYNFVFRNSNYDINWLADYGEDTITAIIENERGNYLMCLPNIQFDSVAPNKRLEGGMSETYDSDTLKLVMRCVVVKPTVVSPKFYNGKFVPMFSRQNSFPKLISERYRNERFI